MKKSIIFFMTIVLCFGVVACGRQQDPGNQGTTPEQTTAPTTTAQSKISPEAKAAVGKTFNQLKKEYPDYVTGNEMYINFSDAGYPYLGLSNAQYSFVFFGTQAGPGLADVGKYYGNKIKCIGVTGKVSGLFPAMTTDLSFNDFFSFLGVQKYDYNNWKATDRPGGGELSFKYKGFDIVIDADGSQSTKIVKKNYPILITKGDTTINDNFVQKTDNKLNPGL